MFIHHGQTSLPPKENHDTSFYSEQHSSQNDPPSSTYIKDFYTTLKKPFEDFSSPINNLLESMPDSQNTLRNIKQCLKGQLKRVLEKFQQKIAYRVGQSAYRLSIRITPHFNINHFALRDQFQKWLTYGKKIVRDFMEVMVNQFGYANCQFSFNNFNCQFESIQMSMNDLMSRIWDIWNGYLQQESQRANQINLRSEEQTREF